MKSKNSQINQIKEDLIATLRAIVCDETVQVEFDENQKNNFFNWNQNLISDQKKIVLPASFEKGGGSNALAFETEDLSSELGLCPSSLNHPSQSLSRLIHPLLQRGRAAADMAACYLLFHDKKIHHTVIPAQAGIQSSLEEQKIFDEFEKARVISSVKNSYLGVVKNILAKVEDDIFSADTALSMLLLNEIFPQEILPKTKDVILDLEKKLSKKILSEIKNLTKNISDQSVFMQGVARIIELLRQEQETQEKEENNSAAESNQEKNQKPKDDLTSFGQENIDAKNEESFLQNQEEESSQKIEDQTKITDLKDDDKKGEVSLKLDKSSAEESGVEFRNAYKIFTSKFDEIIFPQKLVAKNELEYLRDQLDLKLAKLGNISKKMSLKLKKKLLSKRNSFLEYDSSRGVLDRKKLTRLVIDPLIEDVWINNKTHEYQDTALTILLDNSGSMRGNPIVMSAMACEIIAGILEKFSIKTEIIGFTTADWKGGRARKLWESSGRPKNPGRLNELRHIIYKHFNQSFKKSKVNLGLMLKEGVLKENIDGEALLFARARLMQQSEKRKILLVISDGTPVDDSTASANDSDILSDHLNYVINKIEKASKIEIVGIGIGHTTEEFYRNSITIKSLEELGDVMIEKITELL